jgi:hypothetical protein
MVITKQTLESESTELSGAKQVTEIFNTLAMTLRLAILALSLGSDLPDEKRVQALDLVTDVANVLDKIAQTPGE